MGVSCLGHFVFLLLTSEAATKRERGVTGGFSHDLVVTTGDQLLNCHSALLLGVLVNLLLHFILTTPTVAQRLIQFSCVPDERPEAEGD